MGVHRPHDCNWWYLMGPEGWSCAATTPGTEQKSIGVLMSISRGAMKTNQKDDWRRVSTVRIAAMAVAISALTGCAATVEPMTTPDGRQGFLVECNGSADSWASCYKTATSACKGTYKVIDRNESSTPTGLGPLVKRSLIAECTTQ